MGILRVLTVPMRNGNCWRPCGELSKDRSYRTYEEWKLRKVQFRQGTKRIVLTVPMRNGNFFLNLFFSLRSLIVLTVPMRNGNSVVCVQVFELLNVLTVPMRNGNATI